ncbi:MAG: hypothetical protein M1814_004895 [Vezdaea aestivalis]|nr:MAG: hypothetical protein M1814_004895 [Vezdaea aestivalis]
MNKILFWGSFGLAVRLWANGLQMRSFWSREMMIAYPCFTAIGAAFGYWMQGVDERQMKLLMDRKELLLAKRQRRTDRESKETAETRVGEIGSRLAESS